MLQTIKSFSIWQNVGVGSLLATLLTALSYWVAFDGGWITELNNLEVFAVFTSYLCTYLCVVESRWNYPVGVITTCAYAFLFWQMNLPGSAMVNLYLMFQLVYGWFRWGPDNSTRPVTRLKWDKWLLGYVGATFATYAGIHMIFQYFNTALPTADAFIFIATILAQFLLDNKKIDTWKVWFVINIVAIWLYASAGLPLVAFQYVFFLANVFFGHAMWKKSLERDEEIKKLFEDNGKTPRRTDAPLNANSFIFPTGG